MSTYAKVFLGCFRCKGTGIEEAHYEGEELIPERPCPYCGGDGTKSIAFMIDITDIMEELDYIHGKVTAIWNQVK